MNKLLFLCLCFHSELVDVTETRQSRSPLISVYLRKTKQNQRLPTTNNSNTNKSEVAEEILITPIVGEKTEVPSILGSRDEMYRPNFAFIKRPQYYGPLISEMEENLIKTEEDNKFFNLAAILNPPRKPYLALPGGMRPNARPQQNYANYVGLRPFRYPSGYGIQGGYIPQRFTGYAPQTGYEARPDYGYRLGNGPDDLGENPDEEEDNKFFNLSELLSPPRKPYVPGSIRPYSSSRPNYANFLGPNYGRPSYGQSTDQYGSRPYPYYSGYNNFNGYADI